LLDHPLLTGEMGAVRSQYAPQSLAREQPYQGIDQLRKETKASEQQANSLRLRLVCCVHESERERESATNHGARDSISQTTQNDST
jgi:hypothetical protein